MATITRLARRFGLSRTALLYYDRIGLLRARARTRSGYRIYSGEDEQRLEQICRLRKAGLKLVDVRRVLDGPDDALTQALEARLQELNHEVERLRDQQRFILGLLRSAPPRAPLQTMSPAVWKSLLAAAGFTEADLRAWHAAFERSSPDQHQRFLEHLRIPRAEIAAVRARALAHSSPGEQGTVQPARPGPRSNAKAKKR